MKPKFSTGYLTPQSHKKKGLTNQNLRLPTSHLQINDEAFRKLMSCPEKKKFIIKLISSEKDAIEAYKRNLQSPSSPMLKVKNKTVESPTALYRRRILELQNNSLPSNRSVSRQSIASTVPSPVPFNKILEGVIAYVEVKSGDRDRSEGVKAIMRSMGATIRDKITKDVTHIIFKDGCFTTYQKASLLKLKLISILWVDACKTKGVRMPEKDYPAIGTGAFEMNLSTVCSQMQNEYEELVREELSESMVSRVPRIDRRKTIATPNISNKFISTDFTRSGSEDSEVQGFMNNNTIIDSSVIDSDTEAIVDGIFNTNLKYMRSFTNTTNNTNSDMDLTDMHGEVYNCSSHENLSINDSSNIYNKKTPKLNLTEDVSTQSESPNILTINKTSRKSVLLEDKNVKILSKCTSTKTRSRSVSKTTPDQTGDNLTNKNNNSSSVETDMSHLRLSDSNKISSLSLSHVSNGEQLSDKKEKSTSTKMSSLRISDTESVSLNRLKDRLEFGDKSLSPMNPNVMSGILQSLDSDEDVSLEKNDTKTPKNQLNSMLTRNVTFRKKYIPTTSSNDSNIPDDGSGLVLNKPNTFNCEPIEQKSKSCINLRNRKQTINTIGKIKSPESDVKSEDKLINDNSHIECVPGITSRNRRKTFAVINNTVNNKKFLKSDSDKTIAENKDQNTMYGNNEHLLECDIINTRSTRRTLGSTVNNTDNCKSTPHLQTSSTVNNSEEKLNNDNTSINCAPSRITRSRRKTIAVTNTENSEDVLENGRDNANEGNQYQVTSLENNENFLKCDTISKRRTIGSTINNQDLQTKENTCEKSKKIRRLYNPEDDVFPLNTCDEDERKIIRQKTKDNLGIFKSSSILLSNKAQSFIKNNELNINHIFNPKIKPSPTKILMSNNNRINNDDDDKQLNKVDKDKTHNSSTSPVAAKQSLHTSPLKVLSDKSDFDNVNQDIIKSKKKVKPSSAKKHLKTRSSQKVSQVDDDGNGKQINASPELLKKTQDSPLTPPRTNIFKTNVKLTPITPVRNRRSTLDFESKSVFTKNKLKMSKLMQPSIVCTRMHRAEVELFNQIVNKLGKFVTEQEVTKKTTHLVAGEPKRTINMLKAITKGCWILKKEWLFQSLEKGKWLPEEDFEETSFSPAVQKNRLQRQAFGRSYSMDIFENSGQIYISRGSTPRCSDLRDLVVSCKGNVTKIAKHASLVVGEYVRYQGIICVKESWILDSIISNKRLPYKKYLITPKRDSIVV